MKIEEFLKGILIGIAKIIPGLSPGISSFFDLNISHVIK